MMTSRPFIAGIGLDVTSVSRIRRLLEGRLGARCVARCFTEAERSFCDGRKARAECYAARFAAKEALVKALGAPPGVRWTDIEVAREGGAPFFRLTGRAAEALAERAARAHLSLTHDADIAAASVVLEGAG